MESKGEPEKEPSEVIAKRASELLQKISLKNADWIYWLGLIPVFIISWYVRTRNLPLLAGRYLVELDSYFFFRYAKTIFETGSLPAIDMMRYSPLGFPTSGFRFFPETMAFMYKNIVHPIFPNLTQIQWHLYYPPIITLISFVFFFLFVKELFGHRTALASTAFLAVIPAYIQRTSAGFADHEAMAMLWIFISLWLFVLMWKSDDWKKTLLFGSSSGVFTGMAAMTWGGYRFLVFNIAVFFIVALLFKQITVKRLLGYFLWAIIFIVISSEYFSGAFGLSSFIPLDNSIVLFGFVAASTYLVIEKTQIKMPSAYLPRQIASVLLIGIIFMLIGIKIGTINIADIKYTVAPTPQRWSATVAESQQPDFGTWTGQYGWLLWFAVLGGAVLLYKIFEVNSENSTIIDKLKRNKYGILALLAYFSYIVIFTKGRSGLYLPWLAGTIVFFWVLYCAFQRKNEFSNNKFPFVLMFIFLFTTLVLTNIQIRLLFAFAPVAAISSGVLTTTILEKFWRTNKLKMGALIFAVLVVVVFYNAAAAAAATNRSVGPMIPGQWEGAMTFLREQTPQSSVVAHWWDYGHMTAAVGERATVTDGGNVRSWNHASGRYFLTGKDKTSTLEYLKSHNVTHILISDQEIPKYPAFSLIGSDENFDRYSSIGMFVLQDVKEARDGTMRLYGGSWNFDSNILLGNLMLPAGQASINSFLIPKQNSTITQPKMNVVYSGRQFQFDLNCIYAQGQRLDFPATQSTMRGCLVLIPYFKDQNTGYDEGAAFWVSEKVWDTNLARLYLYEENDPNFKLVYKDQTPIVIYQSRPVGPIKIWEVVYPTYIKPDEKYLEYSPFG